MTNIETVRGPIPVEDIGITLPHEHIFTKNQELELSYPHPEWDEEATTQNAIDELNALSAKGINTIVDLTVPGLGRFIPRIQKVAAAVDINIVVATGFYTFKDLPTFFQTTGPGRMVERDEPLEEYFIRDITVGIGDTGVKAAMIKVATDEFGITTDVERVMRSAAIAHLETGATITTHTHVAHYTGRDQQTFFRANGVALENVVIGHCGDSTDIAYLRELMDNGSTLGLDRFGMEQVLHDDLRVETLLELIDLGYAGQLTLSHDAGFFSINTPPSWRTRNAPNWNHANISDRILPKIRERGVSDETIHQIMVTNPARILAGRRSE
ncbi:MAG: phosphotriesterase [Burkholderiaceae bacterium]|nr:phosphotriesterase [Microbacteriaceae bacterium]